MRLLLLTRFLVGASVSSRGPANSLGEAEVAQSGLPSGLLEEARPALRRLALHTLPGELLLVPRDGVDVLHLQIIIRTSTRARATYLPRVDGVARERLAHNVLPARLPLLGQHGRVDDMRADRSGSTPREQAVVERAVDERLALRLSAGSCHAERDGRGKRWSGAPGTSQGDSRSHGACSARGCRRGSRRAAAAVSRAFAGFRESESHVNARVGRAHR